MKIKKILIRIGVFLLFLFVLLTVSGMIFLNGVEVEVTDEDLPAYVYDNPLNINLLMLSSIGDIVLSDESETNEKIETFINLMIYKTIRDDFNPSYDPINGESIDSQYIVRNALVAIDYMIAELDEDNQITMTISVKRLGHIRTKTAIYMVFDMDFSYEDMSLTLSLIEVKMADKTMSEKVYGFIFRRMNNESIEEAISPGTLDLDTYTYQIAFRDYLPF